MCIVAVIGTSCEWGGSLRRLLPFKPSSPLLSPAPPRLPPSPPQRSFSQLLSRLSLPLYLCFLSLPSPAFHSSLSPSPRGPLLSPLSSPSPLPPFLLLLLFSSFFFFSFLPLSPPPPHTLLFSFPF